MNLHKLAKINLFLIISFMKLSNLMADKLTGKLLLFTLFYSNLFIHIKFIKGQ